MADVVIIDRVEDDDYQGKAFKKVTDKTGKTFNVKYGREGKLKAKWDLLIPGTAIKITWGTYNNVPFVQDFEVVAAAGAVAKLEPGKPEPVPLAEGEEELSNEMTKGDWAEKERIKRQSIQRQTAIKASTELAIAKVRAGKETSLNEILAVAITFESYLESGANIEKK